MDIDKVLPTNDVMFKMIFGDQVKEIKDVFERAKRDPEARELMRIREKALLDYASDINTARGEGIGIGVENERRKNAMNMKAEGFDTKVIAKCLGISEKEVEAILATPD